MLKNYKILLKPISVISISLTVFLCLFYGVITSSFRVNVLIASSFPEYSYFYNYSINMSTRLFTDRNYDELDEIRDDIRYGFNQNYHDIYIRIIGLTGNDSGLDVLNSKLKLLERSGGRFYMGSEYLDIIDSLGLICSARSVDILNSISDSLYVMMRDNYPISKRELYDVNYRIARSKYFITGKRYIYNGVTGVNAKIPITNEIMRVHEIVSSTVNRNRNAGQILSLIRFFSPAKRTSEELKVLLR